MDELFNGQVAIHLDEIDLSSALDSGIEKVKIEEAETSVPGTLNKDG